MLFSGHFAANLHGLTFKVQGSGFRVQGSEGTRYHMGTSNLEP